MFLDKHILSIFWGWICENPKYIRASIEKHYAFKKNMYVLLRQGYPTWMKKNETFQPPNCKSEIRKLWEISKTLTIGVKIQKQYEHTINLG